jgi:hypothetical protein
LSEKSIERYVTMLVKENRYQPKAAWYPFNKHGKPFKCSHGAY